MNRARALILLIVAALILILGCAGTPNGTYSNGTYSTQAESPRALALKALQTDKQLYDTAFQAMAALDRQGKLPKAAKEKAIRLGNLFLTAHNSAVQILLDNGKPDLKAVLEALDNFLEFAEQLKEY